MSELLEMLTKEEKETKVLFPETHNEDVQLLGQKIELRPLPISPAKKIAVKMVPLSIDMDKMRTDPDSGSSDLDIKTIDTLLDCVMILVNYYKLPFSRERLEEDATTEEILTLLAAQVALNKENNFLLQSLRVVLRMVEWSSVLYLKSPNQRSMPPIVNAGESTSLDLSIPTPPDSLPSSIMD